MIRRQDRDVPRRAKRRIRRIFGQVSSSELAGIDQGLELFLGLGAAE